MSDLTEARAREAQWPAHAPNESGLKRFSAADDPLSKRLFDRVGAALLLLFFAPFMLVIAIVLRVRDGGPVIFAHERVGRGGKRFRCLKFRTMVPDAEARLEKLLAVDPIARREWEETRKLTEDPRVSCMGDLLRRTSLDELPQLVNVLRGEMSLVGPRPVVLDEIRLYGEFFADYQAVRPGMTGAWQVGGRSNTTYAERVAMDVNYVRSRTFAGDLRILWQTVCVVFEREGAC